MRRSLRPLLPLSLLALASLIPARASAVTCPAEEPTWIQGRFVVYEPNLEPPRNRGVGEIFAYAYERGDSSEGTRYIAVSDAEGDFCIEGTTEGEWVLTVFEPFSFRPVVIELECTAAGCDLGEIALDTSLRISDDYVDFGSDWFGDTFAQTFVAPAGSVSLVKATVRSGNPGTHPMEIFAGQTQGGEPLGRAYFRIDRGTGRDSAIFAPGQVALPPGALFTLVGRGGWSPWRVSPDAYPEGQMFSVDGAGTLIPIADTDMAVNFDIDGPDGNLTSHLYTNSDASENGSVLVQGFVARSRAITHASLFTGPPDGLRRMRASIHASPDGPAIGPTKETQGLQQQGVAWAWFDGEVPVTPGNTYYLRVEYPEGTFGSYLRRLGINGDPVHQPGLLSVDGRSVEGAIWGRIMGPAPSTTPEVDAGPGGADGGGADGGGPVTDAGFMDAGAARPTDPGGCGCRLGGGGQTTPPRAARFALLGLLGLALFALRRRGARRTGS